MVRIDAMMAAISMPLSDSMRVIIGLEKLLHILTALKLDIKRRERRKLK